LKFEELILPFCNRAAKGEGVRCEVGSWGNDRLFGEGEGRGFEGSDIEGVVKEDFFSECGMVGGSVRHCSGKDVEDKLIRKDGAILCSL
jgi:hypothetical protein